MKFLLILLTFVFAAQAATTVEQRRLQIVKKLQSQNYFKYESCPKVADDLLKKFGLPPLGKSKPVKGTRGAFKRPKKPQLLPNVKDEITAQGLNVHIQMQSLDQTRPPQWRIRLERKATVALKKGRTNVDMSSVFTFVSQPYRGHEACELASVTFKLKNKASDASLRPEKVSVRECIDLFLAAPGADSEELKWIKTDCALALHYSSEAKAMAAKKP